MTHVQHIISLYNLPIVADICRNVPPIVRCLDNRISLLRPGASLEHLSESGHCWKIVFNLKWFLSFPNTQCVLLTLQLLRIMSSIRCTMSDVLTVAGLSSFSASVKSVQPSSNIWHWLSVTLNVVHTLSIFHNESLYSWSVLPTEPYCPAYF